MMKIQHFLLIMMILCGGNWGKEDSPIQGCQAEPVKILFLENALLEHSWTFRHDLGRVAVADKFRDQVLTSVVVADEFDDANTRAIVEQYIADGYRLFFGTSSGWIGIFQQLAKEHPDLYWVQNPGWDFGIPNLIGIDGQLYQSYYLVGLLGGAMTKTGKIGLLNGEAGIPLTTNSMNAYCVGAQKGNPSVTCHAITMGNWVDVRLHEQASRQLASMGCDHLVSVTGSYIPDETAAELTDEGQPTFSCGFADDFRVKVGPTVSSSGVFYWDVPYINIVQSLLSGTWQGGGLTVGMHFGAVDAAPPSDLVPSSILPLFNNERQKLIDSAQEIVFCGQQALQGLPSNVVIDNSTGCISQLDISLMGYQMGYVQTVKPQFYYIDIYVTNGSAVYIAMMTCATVCTLLSFFYLALLIRWWTTPVIRFSSPMFCMVIFLGAFLQLISAYLYVQKPSEPNCMSAVWLEMLGIILMLSAICMKNYRLWRVLHSARRFISIQISNEELLAVVILATLGMVAIMIGWQVSDPLESTYSTSSSLSVDERYLYCGDSDVGLWVGLTWGYLAIWIAGGVALAYLTRRLVGIFNESSNIALALYNLVVLELIFLPLIYTFTLEQYDAKVILQSLQPMYRAVTTLSLIFVPKYWIAWLHPDKNVSPTSITRSRIRDSHHTQAPNIPSHDRTTGPITS